MGVYILPIDQLSFPPVPAGSSYHRVRGGLIQVAWLSAIALIDNARKGRWLRISTVGWSAVSDPR